MYNQFHHTGATRDVSSSSYSSSAASEASSCSIFNVERWHNAVSVWHNPKALRTNATRHEFHHHVASTWLEEMDQRWRSPRRRHLPPQGTRARRCSSSGRVWRERWNRRYASPIGTWRIKHGDDRFGCNCGCLDPDLKGGDELPRGRAKVRECDEQELIARAQAEELKKRTDEFFAAKEEVRRAKLEILNDGVSADAVFFLVDHSAIFFD